MAEETPRQKNPNNIQIPCPFVSECMRPVLSVSLTVLVLSEAWESGQIQESEAAGTRQNDY